MRYIMDAGMVAQALSILMFGRRRDATKKARAKTSISTIIFIFREDVERNGDGLDQNYSMMSIYRTTLAYTEPIRKGYIGEKRETRREVSSRGLRLRLVDLRHPSVCRWHRCKYCLTGRNMKIERPPCGPSAPALKWCPC